MASNSFGTLFKITTWGESHGKAIGVVIDGCPAGVLLSSDDINQELEKRAPGRTRYTSPRTEQDRAEIFSGVFEGKTTGAPISIIIPNKDADSSKYEPIKDLLRPGHANYTYLQKYGIFDWRGGGRASARETACRVAAGSVAKKILQQSGILLAAYLCQMGSITSSVAEDNLSLLSTRTYESPLFCPDPEAALLMMQLVEKAKEEGDSLGGVVRFIATGLPAGLGDPIYEKLEAKLAQAMMSLPASKGFEIGSGFQSVLMQGSEHNDRFTQENDEVITETNFAGGTLGGISTGMPLFGQVAFKPTSSIKKAMTTRTSSGEKALFQLPEGSRHDPCVAIRAVPVVEAMLALVLVDSLLLQRSSKL
jgi:chorismate synthase